MKTNFYAFVTPHIWSIPVELELSLSLADKKRLDAIPKGEEHICEGIVAKDRKTGKYYAIRHFPCFEDSYDCCCAAQAAEVSGPDAEYQWEKPVFPDEDDEECTCH